MTRKLIIAIVGESGTGKNKTAEMIRLFFKIPEVVSFTTRLPRPGEKNGREHYFVSNGDYIRTPKEDFLAYTEFGGNHYWSSKKEILSMDSKIVTYVIDEDGLKTLQETASKDQFSIVTIRVHRPNFMIDKFRTSRNKGRFTMKDEEFDYVINNDKGIPKLVYQLKQIIPNIKKLIKSEDE